MTKVSLLLQYRRIFRGFRTRLACLCLMLFVGAWCTVAIVLDALACTPMAILNPSLKDTCLASLLVWTLTSAVNIVTNFAVVVVPIPATWALRLHTRQRVALTVLFGFGFCTALVAIARSVTVKNAALSVDTSWDSSAISYFSVVEVSVGIVCACVLTLRPLLADLCPALVKSSQYGQPGPYGQPGLYGGGGGGGGAYHGPGGRIGGGGGGGGGAGARTLSSRTTTKKSWRDHNTSSMMTHADQGIYGLADLEVEQALHGSQEGLTGVPRFFEPALPRMLTSITGGGPVELRRAGDIMVTRETKIEEEMRTVSPTGPLRAEKGDD